MAGFKAHIWGGNDSKFGKWESLPAEGTTAARAAMRRKRSRASVRGELLMVGGGKQRKSPTSPLMAVEEKQNMSG